MDHYRHIGLYFLINISNNFITDSLKKLNKKLTISKIRTALYKSAKLLGDVNAVKSNKVGERIVSRVSGKVSARMNRAIVNVFKTRKK